MAMDDIVWAVITQDLPKAPRVAERPGRTQAGIDVGSHLADLVVVCTRLRRMDKKIERKPCPVDVAEQMHEPGFNASPVQTMNDVKDADLRIWHHAISCSPRDWITCRTIRPQQQIWAIATSTRVSAA